ncbi:MAG TPA: MoxR family ATPase [Thermoanaerobaculia bacterium]|nr:MoxR family ATPase [Thermoanaerobaculia bacterium]
MTDIQELAPETYELPADPAYAHLGAALGDRRDGRVYVHDDRIQWAVKVAQATNRPLLLRGPAGSGKSSLAPFVTRSLKRIFYSTTVQSRTQARDLLYEFNSLRRLADAQAGDPRARELHRYLEPRPLWWALDPESARRRGLAPGDPLHDPADDAYDPGEGPMEAEPVVLIDEIDKADPDLPNSLLEALGSHQFTVTETDRRIQATRKPLVIITTNEERDLPAAFLRRCVVLFLPEHERADLVRIATMHFGEDEKNLYGLVADELMRLRKDFKAARRRPPSTAEYLDAVKACRELGVEPCTGGAEWTLVVDLTLVKSITGESIGRASG